MRLLAGSLSVLAGACFLGGFERGQSQVVEGEAGGSDACLSPRPPSPHPEAPDGGDVTFVSALRTVVWPRFEATGEGEAADEAIGFDLDGRCTCTEGFRTGCLIEADAPLGNHCDDPEGRDNMLGFALAPIILVTGEEQFGIYLSSAIDAGQWSHLFEVSGYNGAEHDARVIVSSFAVAGEAVIGGPAWQGEDVWPLAESSFADAGRSVASGPRDFDSDAYVVDGHVVAHFPAMGMRIESGSIAFDMRLVEVEVVARIEETPIGLGLRDGVIAGKLTLADGFALLDSFRYGPDKQELFCLDDGFEFEVARGALCNALDLRLGDEEVTATCDAVSVGIGFTADPAKKGALTPIPPPPTVCTAGQEPRNASCKY